MTTRARNSSRPWSPSPLGLALLLPACLSFAQARLQGKEEESKGREREKNIHQELQELRELARKDRQAREKAEQQRMEKLRKEREKDEQEAQKAAQKTRERYEKEQQEVRERAEKLARKYGGSEKEVQARVREALEEHEAQRDAESQAAYAAALRTIRELEAPAGESGGRSYIEWNGRKIPANVYRPGQASQEGPWVNMGGLSRSGRYGADSGSAGIRESGSSSSSFDVRATVIRLDGGAASASE